MPTRPACRQASPEAGPIRTAGNFHGKPIWQRAAVVAAGPIANFILAIVIFASVFAFVGVPIRMSRGLTTVQPGSAAEKAGITSGDLIAAIDGVKIETFGDIVKSVSFRGGELLNVTIDRNGTPIVLNIVVGTVEECRMALAATSRRGLLGISAPQPGDRNASAALFAARGLSPRARAKPGISSATTGHYVGKLFTGTESIDQIGGPIAMAKGAGDTASSGGLAFISFVALLSVSIGLINLFPVPMLDGGHLAFYAVEALRGKPLGPNAQEWGYRIGFSFVVMLMLIGIWNDVARTISVVLGS